MLFSDIELHYDIDGHHVTPVFVNDKSSDRYVGHNGMLYFQISFELCLAKETETPYQTTNLGLLQNESIS